MLKEITGTYGASQTETTIFIETVGRRTWYVCEGSVNVNCTYDLVEDGVDIETLYDVDHFTGDFPVTDLDEFQEALED